jgi:hypothetical protein
MIRFRILVLALLLPFAAAAQTGAFDWTTAPEFAPGLRYTHIRLTEPRAVDVHAMRIDVQTPGLRFVTTGRGEPWKPNESETVRATTRDFVREARAAGVNVIAAINADAFEPWPRPYAERGPTNLRGLAIADGVIVSPVAENSPSFVIYGDGRPAVITHVDSTEGIRTAVSGFGIVLENGATRTGDERIVPRTGIGVSADARYVFWIVIDGRRRASEGATTEEVGRWLLHFGADDGINLDGGGSATMARFDPGRPGDGVVLLNSPVGDGTDWRTLGPAAERDKYKPSERANGNSLGVALK